MHRGPLHYAFDIARSAKVIAQNAAEPLAVDYEFDATGTWQYAIDPSTLKFHDSGAALPTPIWNTGGSPYTITVTACKINWSIAGGTYAAVPPTSPACIGANTTLTLAPYGVSNVISSRQGKLITSAHRQRSSGSARSR